MADVGWKRHDKRRLAGDVVQAMPAMAGHLVVGGIRRSCPVEIQSNDRGARAGNGRVTASAMDQRCQQANQQRDDQRQTAALSTASRAGQCIDVGTAGHVVSVDSPSGLFKAG